MELNYAVKTMRCVPSNNIKWKLHFRETFQSMNFQELHRQEFAFHNTMSHIMCNAMQCNSLAAAKAINVVLRIICSLPKICMYVVEASQFS